MRKKKLAIITLGCSKNLVDSEDIATRLSDKYDIVFVGFPVWWGREPSIVDTFLDAYDFNGKKIIPFCTSGGSGMEGASERIAELTKASVDRGLRLGGDYSEEELKLWTDGLELL